MTLVLTQVICVLCSVALIAIFGFDRQTAAFIVLGGFAAVLAFALGRARLRARNRGGNRNAAAGDNLD
jgi:hypothetical protein